MLPSIKSASFGLWSEKRSASMETSSSTGGLGNWPRIAWLPTTTNRSAPVIPAAARMMCSSCGRCMAAETRLDFPNLIRRQDARKRRVLTESLALLGFCDQGRADLRNGPRQQLAPLGITTQQRWRVFFLTRPPFQVGGGQFKPLGMLRQPGDDPTRQFQTHLVLDFVTHAERLPHADELMRVRSLVCSLNQHCAHTSSCEFAKFVSKSSLCSAFRTPCSGRADQWSLACSNLTTGRHSCSAS